MVHDGLAESFNLVRESRAASAEVKRLLGMSPPSIPWRHQHDNTAALSQLVTRVGHTPSTDANTSSHFDEVVQPLLLGVQRYVTAPHSLQLAPLHRSALAKDLDTAREFLGGWESMHEEDFAKISEMAKLYIDDLVEKSRGSLGTVIDAMYKPDPQAKMREVVRTQLLKTEAFERYGKLTSSIERLAAHQSPPGTWVHPAPGVTRGAVAVPLVAVQQTTELFEVFKDACSIMPQFASFLNDLALATRTEYLTSGLQPWLSCVLSTQRKEWMASALTPAEGCLQIPDFLSGQVCAVAVVWRVWLVWL